MVQAVISVSKGKIQIPSTIGDSNVGDIAMLTTKKDVDDMSTGHKHNYMLKCDTLTLNSP